jgi:hypothetical protein
VLYVDEAQKVWRSRGAGNSKAPAEVLDLETHRHAGVDIVLITQAPSYIDSHLRPLFSEHEHLVAWGANKSRLFAFAECYDDVKSLGTRDRGEFRIWDHPQAMYALYDSAEVHTAKPPIPWKQRVGKPLLLAAAGLCLLYILWQGYELIANGGMSDRVREADAKAKAAAGQPKSSLFGFGAGGKREKRFANLAAYDREYTARDAARPWTMPALDGRDPKADPQLVCMASGHEGAADRTCSCLTEQGTRWGLPKADCERIARWGPAYNPFKPPERAVAGLGASGARLGAEMGVKLPSGPRSAAYGASTTSFRIMHIMSYEACHPPVALVMPPTLPRTSPPFGNFVSSRSVIA